MKPSREHATNNAQTYFVTSRTWESRELFRNECWALLFLDTLQKYRGSGYLLHEFVLMPDHFHVIVSPLISLERAIQYIKGGFSFRAKKELGSNMEVWQRGFSDHRIREAEDYDIHVAYLRNNPVKKGLCASAGEFPYSSASGHFDLDARPQRLKPLVAGDGCGTAKAVPFQSEANYGTAKAVPFQSNISLEAAAAVPFQSNISSEAAAAVPFQKNTTTYE